MMTMRSGRGAKASLARRMSLASSPRALVGRGRQVVAVEDHQGAALERGLDQLGDVLFAVLDERLECDQCLFGKNKVVSDERRDEILADCERKNRYFECHKGTLRKDKVVCAGFVEAAIRGEIPNQLVQVASRLGMLDLVDPATGDPVKK